MRVVDNGEKIGVVAAQRAQPLVLEQPRTELLEKRIALLRVELLCQRHHGARIEDGKSVEGHRPDAAG